jgi:hypothetical protein
MMEDDSSPVGSNPQHERFSHGITDLYVTMEDLRQSLRSFETTTDSIHNSHAIASGRITVDMLQEWQSLMDRMVQIIYFLLQLVPTEEKATSGNATAEEVEILQHSIVKALDSTKQVLQLCCAQYLEPTHDRFLDDPSLPSVEEQRRIGQSAVARIAEMNICLAFHCRPWSASPRASTDAKDGRMPNMEEMVQQYVQFQRRTFRLRCKPSIAELIDRRGPHNVFAPPERVISTASDNALSSWNTHDDESGQVLRRTEQEQRFALLLKQYHAPVFTVVLGVAATLIHPLAAWMTHVVPLSDQRKDSPCTIPSWIHRLCSQSIAVIHEQTEALVKSVAEWFYVDRKYIFDLSSALDDPIPRSATNHHTMPREQQIGLLTTLVDEMAYIAQLLERYRTLVDSCASGADGYSGSNSNLIATSILPEWIWQYSALERRLVAHQWKMSILPPEGNDILATPVCIVIGTDIRVSSCIEDAQYITSQAMERAMSTQSLHAMATIAYAIVRDIWATEALEEPSSKSAMTVHRALWEEIGCWSEPESSLGSDAKRMPNATSPSSGGGFATALLDALDDDMDHPPLPTAASIRSPGSNAASANKPPRSGGTSFLSSLISSSGGNEPSGQRRLDTLFCVCNSLYAAAGACRGLVNTLDEILLDYNDLPMDGSIVKLNGDLSSGQNSPVPATESRASQSEVTKKAMSLIHLARDELLQYSAQYQGLLSDRVGESVRFWCSGRSNEGLSGSRCPGCLDVLRQFFENENYEIDGSTLPDMEADERLEKEMLNPLKGSPLLHQMPHKCEAPIVQIFSEHIANVVVDMLLDLLWMMDDVGTSDVHDENNGTYHSRNQSVPMRFTDWGALLLSKQSRMLQHFVSVTMTQRNDGRPASADTSNGAGATMTTSIALYQIWERLSQVVTILQLEKPMDWLIYHSTSKLTPDEVARTMRLRLDFSNDAIEKVVKDIRGKAAATNNPTT